ncbi:MAG: TVP38/TMEM64 family protein [Thermodesulfobacteriota bacterium]|jgi:uncharacterized membrane protein YdjX (TVP38/TMEM64 family)
MKGKTAPQNARFIFKLLLIILVVFLVLAGMKYFHVQELLKRVLRWVADLGAWGPFFYMVIYILACVFFIPGSILTLGAGVLFGVVKGSIIVSVAATVGATCAFLAGKYLARDWVAKKIRANPKFQAIDEAVAREGWKIVGLTRLSPVFPFNLLNYAYGLTRVSLRDYFFASWIGMMPATVMYVYIGSLAGEIAKIGGERYSRNSAEWALYILGLIATAAVTVYITRIARAALRKKV